jgi:hypothetical protein
MEGPSPFVFTINEPASYSTEDGFVFFSWGVPTLYFFSPKGSSFIAVTIPIL